MEKAKGDKRKQDVSYCRYERTLGHGRTSTIHNKIVIVAGTASFETLISSGVGNPDSDGCASLGPWALH
jgi:hypothetical protein